MARNVRIREPLSSSPTLEYLNQRVSAGWKLIALEWEKEVEADIPEATLSAASPRVGAVPGRAWREFPCGPVAINHPPGFVSGMCE